MKKRMLSLLLALVMTLSLCVPALAADEFEAETVTEVEEQAPEAPAEPEAPEAEVVEEPAVEEPVEAPEIAMAIAEEEEAEDVPMLVALGKVTKEAHYNLVTAIEDAKDELPKVEAGQERTKDTNPNVGVLTVDDIAAYIKDPVKNDPFKRAATMEALEKAIALAEKYNDGVYGAEVDVDVTTESIETLLSATGEFGIYFNASGAKTLVKTVEDNDVAGGTSNMTKANLAGLLGLANAHADTDASVAKLTMSNIKPGMDVTTDKVWTKAYQGSYLIKLQAAIDAYNALPNAGSVLKMTYEDFVKATDTALAALVEEQAGAHPVNADATKLLDAIGKAESALKNYDPNAYVLGLDDGEKDDDASLTTIYGLIKTANDLFSKRTSVAEEVKFDDKTTFFDVNDIIWHIENALLKAQTPTIKLESTEATPGTVVAALCYATISVKAYDDELACNFDGNEYGIAWEVQQKGTDTFEWFVSANAAGASEFKQDYVIPVDSTTAGFTASGMSRSWQRGTGEYDGEWVLKEGQIYNVGSSGSNNFEEGDVVKVHFYKRTPSGWVEIDDSASTIKIVSTLTAAPMGTLDSGTAPAYSITGTNTIVAGATATNIVGAKATYAHTWNKETGALVVTLTDAITDIANYDYQIVAVQNGKAVGSVILDSETYEGSDTTVSVPVDEKVAVGPLTVYLQACKVGSSANAVDWTSDIWTTLGKSATVYIDPITVWKNNSGTEGDAVKNMRTAVTAAKALKSGDYEMNSQGIAYGYTIAKAFDMIKEDAELIEGMLNAKTPNTAANHNKLALTDAHYEGYFDELMTVCKYLEPLQADLTEYDKLMTQAKGLIDDVTKEEGTGKYTFDTIGKLNELYNDYDGIITIASLKSAVADAVAALDAAIKGLAPIATVNKTQLQASVDEAKKLKEADYTPETWKAVKDALEAAEAVLAKEDATQAQLTNAAEKLTKAVNALEKTEAALKAEAKEKLDAAVTKAGALTEANYTAETWAELEKALDNAEKLADNAPIADIEAAAAAIEAAIEALKEADKPDEPEEPTVPAAPAGGTGWVKDKTTGTWYYYEKSALQKGWIFTGSKHGLWYYCDPTTGELWTGFKQVKDPKEPKYDGWYYFTPSGDCIGAVTSGWQKIGGTYGWGYFEKRHNGHFGACTYTDSQGDYVNYQPTK